MTINSDFFTKNKVFIIGLLGAILTGIQGFTANATIDWKAVGYAVMMAVLSYIANTWRGQGVSITGIAGTLASVFVTNFNGLHINWNQFILLSVAAILAAVAPPPKSLGYEKSSTIVSAKAQGAQIQNKLENSKPPQL